MECPLVHHFEEMTENSKFWTVMSLVMIWLLMLFTLDVCSLIFSSSSASWSCSGCNTSSVIFYCSTSFCEHVWLSFFQKSNSLLMESISSVTKSILFPSGFVLWQRTWIAFFMNSMSCSVKPPPPDGFSNCLYGSAPDVFFSPPGLS